jgi:serine/threonine-protein kinase
MTRRSPSLDCLERLSGASPPTAEEALAALRSVVATVEERAAIDAVLRARSLARVPEAVVAFAARTLADRGERDAARALLEHATTPEALVLAAELEEIRGDLPRALSLVERALFVDVTAPGARSAHDRLRRALGAPLPRVDLDAETLLGRVATPTGYRVLREVGRGAAGTVYEAFDDRLGRRVAFKVYHRPKDDRQRLIDEARLSIALAGPGVVRVFDADPDLGFVAMEWARAGSLAGALASRDAARLLPIERWFVPLARAVARVHRRGIVHGDIKPGNVLFRAPFEPLLSDFGVACRPGEPGKGGTLGYLSPERLDLASVEPDDDVYALGRVLGDAVTASGGAASSDWARVAVLATAPRHGPSARPADAAALLAVLPEAP